MVMNTRQKGRKLVKWGVDFFRDIDSGTYEVVGSGVGKEKGDQRVPRFDLIIEWKNQKTLSIGKDILQAQSQGLGYNNYALAFRHPKSPEDRPEVYFVIHADYFKELIQRSAEPKIKEPDRNICYKLKSLIKYAKEVIKEVEQ